jgi:hypothetical protein
MVGRVKLKKRGQKQSPEVFPFLIIALLLLFVFIICLRYLISLRLKSEASLDLKGIRYTLKMKKTVFQVGEDIALKLEIKNTTSRKLVLNFNNNLEYDFIVQRDISWGVLNIPLDIWKYSANVVVKPHPHSLCLLPQEKKVYCAVWNQMDHNGKLVKPGRYVITGIVTAEGIKAELQIRGRTRNIEKPEAQDDQGKNPGIPKEILESLKHLKRKLHQERLNY